MLRLYNSFVAIQSHGERPMETGIILLVAAGVIAMDTTSGPQFLLSEPVVSCAVLGVLFHRPEFGLWLGILFQLLWLGYLPLGAARLSDGNMAAFIATASLFLAQRLFAIDTVILKAAVIPALFFGIAVGAIGLHLTQFTRKMNGKRNDVLRSRLAAGTDVSPARTHCIGIGSSFLRGVIMALVLVPVGTVLLGCIRFLSAQMATVMSTASLLIWGTVSASAVLFFWRRERRRYFVLGSLGGIVWILFLMFQKN